MNPYQVSVTCSICGGPGVATMKTAVASYVGEIAHSNPAVCAHFIAQRQALLERKAKELAKREEELSKREASIPAQ